MGWQVRWMDVAAYSLCGLPIPTAWVELFATFANSDSATEVSSGMAHTLRCRREATTSYMRDPAQATPGKYKKGTTNQPSGSTQANAR